jgi:hypothetical protein
VRIIIETETLDMAVAGLRVLKRELTEGGEYSLGQNHKVNRMYPVTNDSGSGFMLRITPTGYTVKELVLVEEPNCWDYWKNVRKKGK